MLVALVSGGCVRIESGHQGVLFKLFGGDAAGLLRGRHSPRLALGHHVRLRRPSAGRSGTAQYPREQRALGWGLDVSIRFRPQAAELPPLHQEIGPNYYAKIIKPTIRAEVRKIVGQFTPEEIYSTKRQEVETAIIEGIEAALEDKHVIVEAILIRNVELPEKLRIAISEKLEEEQRAEKMVFTLDRERQEAQRKAIEAQGIAEFQKIVSQGLTADLLRWKGIEATESLSTSENAKVVVIGSGPDGLPLILGGN